MGDLACVTTMLNIPADERNTRYGGNVVIQGLVIASFIKRLPIELFNQ
jgi:hypothetical protein